MNHEILEDNPFLGRIQAETPVYRDEYFQVVHDVAPVVDGHLLLFPRFEALALADCDLVALERFVTRLDNECVDDTYLWVERGRALSCTSVGVVHAHAHLVPERAFPQFLFRFRNMFPTAAPFDSMTKCLGTVPPNCPYVAWGQLKGGVSWGTKSSIDLPKRLIRQSLEQAVRR